MTHFVVGADRNWIEKCLACGHSTEDPVDICPACGFRNRHNTSLLFTETIGSRNVNEEQK